jgi:hypothetical protein
LFLVCAGKTLFVGQAWWWTSNSATPEELITLGLDERAIQRLIENRPYRHKLELVSRLVLPRTVYGRIRHRIAVGPRSTPARVA